MRGLRLAALLLVVLAVALPPPTSAGSADAPELTDPAGDQTVTAGVLVVPGVNDEAFADLDIVAAWFSAPNRTRMCDTGPEDCAPVVLVVNTTAAWTTGLLVVSFNVERGPTSLHASTAHGQAVTFTVNGTAVNGPLDAVARIEPDGLHIDLAIVGAIGGDLLTNLTLATSRSDAGSLPVAQDDQSGSDDAAGTAAFTIPRPAPVARATLLSKGGTVLSTPPRDFPGPQATVNDTSTDVRFTIQLQNTGTDPDDFTFAYIPPSKDASAVVPAIAEAPIHVDPNQVHLRNITVQFFTKSTSTAKDGDVFAFNVTVTSARGASATQRLQVVLDLPDAPAPPPAPRNVVPAKLDFLTPAAEALGFDDAFEEYAEAALLALIVLLTILALFLLLFLGRSTLAADAANQAPPLASAPPAASAPAATAAALAGRNDSEAADEPAAPAILAPAPASATLGIESVTHDPTDPAEGEEVETAVVLRNGGGASTQVRVVLVVGGANAAEQQAIIPSRSAKTVRLAWTAGPGDNAVRVRVFPL